jgi:hypothetical protein
MAVTFNPFTGNLDFIDTTAAAGSDTEIQFNDGGVLAGDDGLVFNKTTNKVTTKGDIELNDGGASTTTLQVVTPTQNNTISFPNATGTVALVAGSSGQAIYNDAGAYSGLSTVTTDGTDVTLTGRFIGSLNGALSATGIAGVPAALTGTWIATGGTATTTKPQFLIEPAGTISTAWSTAGTGLGINATSGFTGRLLDAQVNGTSNFSVSGAGATTGASFIPTGSTVPTNGLYLPAANSVAISTNGSERLRIDSTGRLGLGTSNPGAKLGISESAAGSIVTQIQLANGSTALGTHGTAIQFRGFYNTALISSDGVPTSTTGGNLRLQTYVSDGVLNTGIIITRAGNVGIGTTSPSSLLHLADAGNITVGTTTGTKIGTATTQKLGFYNATPVVQPTAVANSVDTTDIVAQFNALLSRMRDLGLIAT